MTPGDTPLHRNTCLTEDEALAYVSAAAQGERDLALEEHIDRCEGCRVMLAEASRGLSVSPSSPSDQGRTVGPTSLTPGQVLVGRYTIVRFVARGGMGEVYEAVDSVMKETLALKTILSTDLDDPMALQRMLAEVRLARQVTHPNVCRIYELALQRPERPGGRHAEQIPFVTMEFLRGETLDRRLARGGAMPPDEVERLLEQMVGGLGAIHAAGIIHRDIKPHNMALVPGPPERLVLMDFGLARSADPTQTSRSTSGARLTGTIDYMAPEQIDGKPLTPQVDIYAVGLVLFEMLTGQKPFVGGTALSSAVNRMVQAPPRPSDLVPSLDPRWDTLVGRCLAADPAARFARIQDVVLPAPVARRRPRWPLVAGIAAFGAAAAAAGFVVKRLPHAPAPIAARQPSPSLEGRHVRPVQRVFAASGCSEDMVRVANWFCIDRYESATIDDLEERTLSPYYPPSFAPEVLGAVLGEWDRRVKGGTTGLPVPLPILPEWQRQEGWRPRAVSRAGVLPQGYTSKIIAAVACASAGKRLCNAEDWRIACQGEKRTKFPYGREFRAGACNIARVPHGTQILQIDYTDGLLDPRMNLLKAPDGPLLRNTGATPQCASRWGNDAVYDMVGNLDEWVDDGEHGALLGGFYWRPTQEGCDATNARHTPGYFNYSTGFRCCDRLR